jgi:hypothetical protein
MLWLPCPPYCFSIQQPSCSFSKNPAIYPEKQRKLVSFLKGTTLPTGTYQGQLSFQIGHTYGEDLVVEKQFPIVIEAAKS